MIRRELVKILVLLAVAASPCCMHANRHHTAPLPRDIYIYDGSSCEGLGKGEIEKKVKRIISSIRDDKYYPELDIFDPDDETIFPKDLASHTFIWEDQFLHSTEWLITIRFEKNNHAIYVLTDQNTWTPKRDLWELFKAKSLEKKAYITVLGVNGKKSYEITTKSSISVSTSKDAVGAPILYQQMPLPFALAKSALSSLGGVSVMSHHTRNLPLSCKTCPFAQTVTLFPVMGRSSALTWTMEGTKAHML